MAQLNEKTRRPEGAGRRARKDGWENRLRQECGAARPPDQFTMSAPSMSVGLISLSPTSTGSKDSITST